MFEVLDIPEFVGWIIVGIITVLVFFFILARVVVVKMTKRPGKPGKRTPKDLGFDYEEYWIPTTDGIKLNAWFVPRNSDRTIIIAHGFTAAKNIDPYDEGEHYCFFSLKLFAEAGYNVLLFDFRAHGKSEGEFTTIGLKEGDDLVSVVKWLKENKKEEAKKIGVIGYSMGAAATIFALTKTEFIDAAIADSPYGTLKKAIKRVLGPLSVFYPFLRFWAKRIVHINPDEISPINVAKNIKAPLFLIVGTKDKLVAVEDVKKIYEEAKKSGHPVDLWIVDGALHVRSHLKETENYKKKVLSWFDKYLQ